MILLPNILITGSRGFIGENLKKELLKNENINLFEFNRNDSFESLNKIIKNINFIFHLAGEVKPTSSDEEFLLSHNDLTNQIIHIIEKNNCKIPILFTSSKHAVNPKNMYGKTKQETEKLIIEYGERNKTPIYIYRLSHVFGEGCKPNHNSVITTWIYNSINNLEIKLFDKNINMRYIYVKDIVKNFINKLYEKDQKEIFHEIEEYYDTTLGEVVDNLEEFKENLNNEKYSISNNDKFKIKLFQVYNNYKKFKK